MKNKLLDSRGVPWIGDYNELVFKECSNDFEIMGRFSLQKDITIN